MLGGAVVSVCDILGGRAAGIARDGFDHTIHMVKVALDAPEAAARKDRGFQIIIGRTGANRGHNQRRSHQG